MNRYVAALAAVTLLGAGGSTLRAQSTLDTTFSVRGNPRLSVNNMEGRVTVTSWGRAAIRLQADYDADETPIVVQASATRVSVRTEVRGGDNEVDYRITVPVGTSIDISGVSPDVQVTSVCGPVDVNVVSGDVTLTCASGDNTIQSVSGDVIVSDVRDGSLDARSVSGDVTLRNIKGSLTTNAVSGDLQMSGIDATDVNATTVSGDIGYAGRIADNGHYKFESHSGDVTIGSTGTLNATVQVSTFSGDFSSPDFPITVTGRQDDHDWQFTVGSGSARLSLKSFSGTITLRRGPAAGRNQEE